MLSHKDQAVGDERLLVKYVHVEVMSDEINGVGERLTAVLGKAFPETRHRHGAFYYFHICLAVLTLFGIRANGCDLSLFGPKDGVSFSNGSERAYWFEIAS
ncbi:hypothetical protein HMSSN036_94350 [Paenibacillus macerans]|nr:hypothetical protein HMSSN036_94350 [Paenibacillus macerans]